VDQGFNAGLLDLYCQDFAFIMSEVHLGERSYGKRLVIERVKKLFRGFAEFGAEKFIDIVFLYQGAMVQQLA
jgi:hypothetical protein